MKNCSGIDHVYVKGVTVPSGATVIDCFTSAHSVGTSRLLWNGTGAQASSTGTRLTRVHEISTESVSASGVRPFSTHDLRTTGATWLRDAGVDELVIALLLGHRSTFDAGQSRVPCARFERDSRVHARHVTALREAVAVFDRRSASRRKRKFLRVELTVRRYRRS